MINATTMWNQSVHLIARWARQKKIFQCIYKYDSYPEVFHFVSTYKIISAEFSAIYVSVCCCRYNFPAALRRLHSTNFLSGLLGVCTMNNVHILERWSVHWKAMWSTTAHHFASHLYAKEFICYSFARQDCVEHKLKTTTHFIRLYPGSSRRSNVVCVYLRVDVIDTENVFCAAEADGWKLNRARVVYGMMEVGTDAGRCSPYVVHPETRKCAQKHMHIENIRKYNI